MKVLIVSKTHMSSMACVGAIDMTSRKSIRLMNPGGYNQPGDTDFVVRDVWELGYIPRQKVHPPHVEDVIITRNGDRESTIDDIVAYVLASGIPIWRGGVEQLFDGNLHFTSSGSGYASSPSMPNQSVGFWIADKDLVRNDYEGRVRYAYRIVPGMYNGQKSFPFVGYDEPVDKIPAGTLLRVSLARPYAREQNDELKCWLQLSGWYGLEAPDHKEKPDDDDYLPF